MDQVPTPDRDAHACPVRVHERAFSLVEMLIAFVLFAIASGVVMTIVMQGLGGSSDARAGGLTDAAIRRTTEALQDDVARAATADSRAGDVRDELMLADAVRTGAQARRPYRAADGTVDPGRPLVAADIDDVRIARPDQLQLIVGDQCITWFTREETRQRRRMLDLMRRTAPATNCAAATETRRFLSANTAAGGVDRTPFSYRLMCNANVCAGSSAPRSTPCRPWTVAGTVPQSRLRWIVGVEVSLYATSEARGTGSAAGSFAASIRTRDVERYREALGC